MKAKRADIDWRLCLIADSEAAAGQDILRLIVEAVEGGVTIVQLRGKKWTTREFLDAGRKAAGVLKPRKIPLIINDRVDIAVACQADGVHLGQDDLPVAIARRILGKERIIGLSVCSAHEARAAEREGADYIGVGPIFPTLSKTDAGPVVGLEVLRAIRKELRLPILAIGGIAASNAAEVIASGADGVAVISAISAAGDHRLAASEIIEAIGKLKKRRAGSRSCAGRPGPSGSGRRSP